MTKARTRARRLLEQDQRAQNIGLDESLTRMGRDMGFVQRGGMQHRVDALQAARDQSAVGDRPDCVGEGSGDDVEAEGRATVRAQSAHQRFTQMPRAAGDEHCHSCVSLVSIQVAF
jgi:hypothetical protein